MNETVVTRSYAVRLRAYAEMVVWVEAKNPNEAKRAAVRGDYEQMTDWEPISQTRSVMEVKLSKAPETEEEKYL